MTQAARRKPRMGLDAQRERQLTRMAQDAPFVLRITNWKEVTGPVLVVKERRGTARRPSMSTEAAEPLTEQRERRRLIERGHISGEPMRRVLAVVRSIVSRVRDAGGVPLQADRRLTPEGMRQPVTLPLDEEAGAKLALIFRLHERIADLDRVELIARRVERLTAEEASYWLSRITRFDPAANRWAMSGLRILLGGQPRDRAIGRMLERLR